jgi:hypothetical protein
MPPSPSWQRRVETAKLLALMISRIRLVPGYLLWLLLSAATMAQEPPPAGLSVDTAPAARARAKEIRAAAERRFQADKADCNTRMLALGCLTTAQDRRAASVQEAEALQKEASRVEREARAGQACRQGSQTFGQGCRR